MAGSEVITLQVGHYANFVGAHWWNMQEGSFGRRQPGFEKEINHDRFFHTGCTSKGEETYTPRMVFMDLKGSLRHLRRDGTLYESGDTDVAQVASVWQGSVNQEVTSASAKNQFLSDLDAADAAYMQQQTGVASAGIPSATTPASTTATAAAAVAQQSDVPMPDRYYDLDDTVEVWSDYLRPHLHPRSACAINRFTHCSDSDPFDVYSMGLDVMQDISMADQFEDQVRFFAEACDRLQGYQLLTDIHNGFGGVSSEVVDFLRDEYEKKSIFTVATMPPCFEQTDGQHVATRSLSAAFSFQHLSEASSMLLPLSTSTAGLWPSLSAGQTVQSAHINYRSDLSYHTSALLAATLDTVTLPYRLKASSTSIHQVADLLTPLGRKVVSAYTALPFPFRAGSKLVDCFAELPALHSDSLSMSMTPLTHDDELAYAQHAVLCGIPPELAKQTDEGDLKPDDAFRTYLGGSPSAMINSSCYVKEASVVSAPFPNIFKPSVTVRGFVETEEAYLRPPGYAVHTLPVMAALQSRNSSSRLVEHIVQSAEEAQPQRQFAFYQSSLSTDSWSETRESLRQLSDNYLSE
ncbi:protein misato homolog 1-like [Sycon ciliatum]|uniref:protein misato homolog 1-like n=1 Tax=Sycon ciliatum TaxID=27933 RepID=UPI0031F60DD1